MNLFLKDPKIVLVLGVVCLIGYASEIFLFDASFELTLLNIFCSGLTTLTLIWCIVKKPNPEICLTAYAIIILVNLLIAPFLQFSEPNFSAFFIRNSLVFLVLMPLLGLTINKKVFLTCTFIYLIQYAVIMYLSENSFLVTSSGLVVMVVIGYVYVIFYLFNTLENSHEKASVLIEDLKLKNIELNEKQEELRSLVRTKDKLFSIIAHDLRSPFMGISGLSKMITDISENDENSNISKYSTMITETTIRMNTLFSNLLDWAASQTGELEMKPQIQNLDFYIDETLELLYDIQKTKQVKIERIDTALDIYADPNGIKTILRNLISNALKFTPEHGSITISAANQASKTVISISDTGVGIQVDKLNEIFSDNTFISTKGTNKEPGNGIGLQLCKEMVSRHNGKIWVESEPNKGTAFHFTLPHKNKEL